MVMSDVSTEDLLFFKETIDLYKEVTQDLEKYEDLPDTILGQILAISDRIDNLVGHFGTGKRASGSKDPYGLKRDASAVLRIIIGRGLDLDLRELIVKAKELYGDCLTEDPTEPLLEFFRERLRSYYDKQNALGRRLIDERNKSRT